MAAKAVGPPPSPVLSCGAVFFALFGGLLIFMGGYSIRRGGVGSACSGEFHHRIRVDRHRHSALVE